MNRMELVPSESPEWRKIMHDTKQRRCQQLTETFWRTELLLDCARRCESPKTPDLSRSPICSASGRN